jgi:hypothetical protein
VQKIALAAHGHVAIDHDEINERLKFIPCGATYRGTQPHKLLFDGGKTTVARMVSIASSALPFLPAGTYEPQMARNGKTFDIAYGAR